MPGELGDSRAEEGQRGNGLPVLQAADLFPQPGEKQPLDLGKLVSSVAAQRLVLDTLPGREPRPWGLVPGDDPGPEGVQVGGKQ